MSHQTLCVFRQTQLMFDLDKINIQPIQTTNDKVSLRNSLITQTGVNNCLVLEIKQLLNQSLFNTETDSPQSLIFHVLKHSTQDFLKNMGFIGFNCNQSLQKKKKKNSTLYKLTDITVVNSKSCLKIHSTV